MVARPSTRRQRVASTEMGTSDFPIIEVLSEMGAENCITNSQDSDSELVYIMEDYREQALAREQGYF
jgi:hypothetical protein